MSAETNELLQQQAQTAELYMFTYNGATYLYTSHQENLSETVANTKWIAIPIKRSEYTIGIGGAVSSMRIDIYFKGTIFESLRSINNTIIDVVIAKALITGINDNYIFYKGKIKKIAYERQVAQIECISGGFELDRIIPTPVIQQNCNNVLFDSVCSLIRSKYELRVRITSISNTGNTYGYGSTIGIENYTADGLGAQYSSYDPSRFVSGVFQANDEYANIMYSGVEEITLSMKLSDSVQVGSIVSIFPSCNKLPATCLNTFNNLTHFVGFPYLPTADPEKWGIEVL